MEKYLKNKVIQESIVVLALGIALAAYSLFNFYTAKVQTAWIMSPYLFPLLIAVFVIVVSFSLFAEGRYEVKQAELAEAPGEGKKKSFNMKNMLIALALCIAYCFLLPYLTFVPASILFLAAMIWFLGERRIWLVGAISVVMPVLLYVIFAIGLSVRLP